MAFSENFKDKLLPILISRISIFLFLMCLLSLFLYAAGTVQGFIDTTQISLLSLYVVLGILLALTSISGVVISLIRFKKSRKIRYLFRTGGYMLLMIFGSATILAIMFIITLASGNR